MEIKYEPVFGDQSLFDGAPEEVTHVTKGGGFYNIENMSAKYFSDGIFNGADVLSVGGYLIAERRIIRTPTWSIADQKAGKLPEVGCLVVNKTGKVSEVVTIKNGYFVLFECGKNNGPLTIHGDLLMNQFKPIESPEEKAARLREEWCSNALDSASILSGMREYDLKRLGGYIGNIYDAMLSGDLPVPVEDDK